MKAPSDSIIYWSLMGERTNECIVPMPDFNTSALSHNIQACNSTTIYASQTKDLIDDTYALFRLELKVKDIDIVCYYGIAIL